MLRARQNEQQQTGPTVDFLELVTEVIDLRSFSNLWYWIVLAILWSTLSHWVLGVPFHIVARARRGHAESAADMRLLAEVNVRSILGTVEAAGPGLVGMAAFVITALAVLGFGYGVEFCQAVLLLFLPLVCVGGLSVVTARKLRAREFDDLAGALRLHRMMVQAMGVVFIFVTAMWGMYTNVTFNPLN
jgi:hypothetical protein